MFLFIRIKIIFIFIRINKNTWKNYIVRTNRFRPQKSFKKAEILRETIGCPGYSQLDPLAEYKNEAFKLFIETITKIKYNLVCNILKMLNPELVSVTIEFSFVNTSFESYTYLHPLWLQYNIKINYSYKVFN